MSYRVVFTDHTFDELAIERDTLSDIDAELVDGEATAASRESLVADADALLVMYDEIDADLIASMDECRVISRTGIGVDNVDIAAATERGIYVTNVPDYCVPEVADHTLALGLALQRKIVEYDARVKDGEWDVFAGRPMRRLTEQTWGLVGFGKIARAVANRAAAHEMDLLAYDAYLSDDRVRDGGAEAVGSLSLLLEAADVVSVHVPLTPETEGMIGTDELETMKETAYLINPARGGIVDEEALTDALADGEIAGAGLDVLSNEPPREDHPLIEESRAVLSPHAAFSSEESLRELREKAARNVRDVLAGETPMYLVNDELAE